MHKKIEYGISNNLSPQKNNGQKWDKIINQFNGNIIENVNNIKQQADFLEKEAFMKEKILNLNGGIENNPELGQKVSSLLQHLPLYKKQIKETP